MLMEVLGMYYYYYLENKFVKTQLFPAFTVILCMPYIRNEKQKYMGGTYEISTYHHLSL
jgi:hypothetical protein